MTPTDWKKGKAVTRSWAEKLMSWGGCRECAKRDSICQDCYLEGVAEERKERQEEGE